MERSMKNHYKKVIALWFSLVLFCGSLLTGCHFTDNPSSFGQSSETSVDGEDTDRFTQEEISVSAQGTQTGKSASKMKVHFLDVGQGSSVLVESAGHFLLMDGGDRDASSKVVAYLKKQGVKKLDYIIVSHYDSDHLNGVVGALQVFPVKKVIAPGYTADSRVYQSFVEAVKAQGIKRTSPKPGKKYTIGKAKFTILAPNNTGYSDENNYSVAIRLVHGKERFVITGDAETESEYEMLENGQNLSCDVYMAGHHGSAGSSSERFLQALKPQYTVISVGEDNQYGHPSQEAMQRFKAAGVKIFRTDEQGTVIAVSNGRKLTWNHKPSTTWAYREYGSSECIGGKHVTKVTDAPVSVPGKDQGEYIGNVNSKRFHLPTCGGLPDEKNRIYFDSRQKAVDAGYRPCGLCHP